MKNTKITCQKTTTQIIKIPLENQSTNISTKLCEKLTSKGPLGRQMAPTGAALGSQTVNKSTSVASEARPRPAQGAFLTTSSSFLEFWEPQNITFGSLAVPRASILQAPVYQFRDISHHTQRGVMQTSHTQSRAELGGKQIRRSTNW